MHAPSREPEAKTGCYFNRITELCKKYMDIKVLASEYKLQLALTYRHNYGNRKLKKGYRDDIKRKEDKIGMALQIRKGAFTSETVTYKCRLGT